VRERLPALLGVVRMRSLYGRVKLSQLDPEAGWVERRVPLQPRGLQRLMDGRLAGEVQIHSVEGSSTDEEQQQPAGDVLEVRGWFCSWILPLISYQ